jgi:hypothetical protein
MKTTGVDDLALVRELMEKYRGDVDSVYNDIYERQYPEDREEGKEEEGGDVEGEQEKSSNQDKNAESSNQEEKKAGSRKGTPRPSTPNVSVYDPALPKSTESQKETGSSPEDTESPSTPSEGVKGVIPKKRISAREKKEAAKRNQKHNRKNKCKTHPSGGDGNSSFEKASSTLGGDDGKGSAKTTSSTMRELFV